MNNIRVILVVLAAYTCVFARAAEIEHPQFSPHNFVLFGGSAVYASHIVYKQPHNYQVIFELKLNPEVLVRYLRARARHPAERFIFLLDSVDLRVISSIDSLVGSIFYLDPAGKKHEIANRVFVPRGRFRVIYFDELPLSLKTGP